MKLYKTKRLFYQKKLISPLFNCCWWTKKIEFSCPKKLRKSLRKNWVCKKTKFPKKLTFREKWFGEKLVGKKFEKKIWLGKSLFYRPNWLGNFYQVTFLPRKKSQRKKLTWKKSLLPTKVTWEFLPSHFFAKKKKCQGKKLTWKKSVLPTKLTWEFLPSHFFTKSLFYQVTFLPSHFFTKSLF